MSKQYILFLLLILPIFVACSNEDPAALVEDSKAVIGFRSSTEDSGTRSGETASDLLNNKFVVYGTKSNDSNPVFDGVEVKYTDGTWTYTPLQNWDMTANSYAFTAYSLGKGETSENNEPTYATVSEGASIDDFTVTGNKAQLLSCYFTDKQIVNSTDFNKTVDLKFNQLAAKVRVGFWENIAGYSVKDIKFYATSETSEEPSSTVMLFADNKVFPNGGSYTISYDSDNKAQFAYSGTDENKSSSLTLKTFEPTTIGATQETCTYSGYELVLPTLFTSDIKIKISYTLVNNSDNSDTTTKTKTAEITKDKNPKWDFQKRYSLVFKITENGVSGEMITLKDNEWDNDYRH